MKDPSSMKSREKIEYIIKGLEDGKDREAVALEVGYKNYKSMDMFMRRQDYTWDRKLNMYLSPEDRKSAKYAGEVVEINRSVSLVLKLFKQEMDPREVAKKLKFSDHRDLAKYMGVKGYVWDNDSNNYKKEDSKEDDSNVKASIEAELNQSKDTPSDPSVLSLSVRSERLLEYLLEKENKLKKLLDSKNEKSVPGVLPRYGVPGDPLTKSIHMKNQLAHMITDFSKEKNVKQADIVECAVIEYFMKYGYRKEVERLLNQK